MMSEWSLVKIEKNKKVIIIGLDYKILTPAFIDNEYVYYEKVGVHNANAIIIIDISESGVHNCKAIIKRPSKYLTNMILNIHDCPSIRSCLGVEPLDEAHRPQWGCGKIEEKNITNNKNLDVSGGSHGLTPDESMVGNEFPPKTAALEGADISTLFKELRILTEGICYDYENNHIDDTIVDRLGILSKIAWKLRVMMRKELRRRRKKQIKDLEAQLADVEHKLLNGGLTYEEVQKLWQVRSELMSMIRELKGVSESE